MTKPLSYQILGVRVDAITITEAITQITAAAADPTSPARYVVKPYVEFIDRAATDPEVRDLLNGAWLSLADGVALQWAAHYLYNGRHNLWRLLLTLKAIVFKPSVLRQPLPERVSGIGLTWPMLEAAAQRGLKVYLVGHPQGGDISQTVGHLQDGITDLNIVGSFDAAANAAINRQAELTASLHTAQPDLILVGIGFPSQERLMNQLCQTLSHGILVGEGGSFDYQQFGGRIRRAPRWVSAIGLEWLWRLIREPRRWRRQLAIPRFVWQVYRAGK